MNNRPALPEFILETEAMPCNFLPAIREWACMKQIFPIFASLFSLFVLPVFAAAADVPRAWQKEWPQTDFSKSTVDFSEILSGGPPKDGIPAIDDPTFRPVREVGNIGESEPVIYLSLGGETKAYPLRIMMWHEIANDTIAGTPVSVTYCPLCNAAVVFDRRVNGRVLDFGVSGKLRHSDMIMYDRQTESWWQQFVGRGIVGEMTGVELTRLPARVIPFSDFKASFPDGLVLEEPARSGRRYGENPYAKYDSSGNPFLYRGDYDGPGAALSYVVAVDKDAWLLADIREAGSLRHGDLLIEWEQGMNSALDARRIDQGRDIGHVRVRRESAGELEDVVFDTTFAFAFKAFHPEGVIHELEE